MNYGRLYRLACNMLRDAENECPASDARVLMEHFFGMDRLSMLSRSEDEPDGETEKSFLDAVKRRCGGYPLQYIVGVWSFMDCELEVGEGVLIPRDDTEVCVRACMELIDTRPHDNMKIIDLCSGTGAIAIALAKKYPDADVTAVELSDEAFSYLQRNIRRNDVTNVSIYKGDILCCYDDFKSGSFDVLISNPPYIALPLIPTLQPELNYEPPMALEGGSDGMDFYRVICSRWLRKVRPGGIISMEIGEEQGEAISNMLKNAGAKDVIIHKDIQYLDRAITGTVG